MLHDITKIRFLTVGELESDLHSSKRETLKRSDIVLLSRSRLYFRAGLENSTLKSA